MSRLKNEIRESVSNIKIQADIHSYELDKITEAASEVAKRYIEKALSDASMTNYAYKKTYQQAAKEWKIENGIE
jgi:tRNA(Ser,Leu) C12 N-acetylase TAN1